MDGRRLTYSELAKHSVSSSSSVEA